MLRCVDPRRVVIVAFDGVQLLDVTGPADVFTTASRVLQARRRDGGNGDGPGPDRAATTGATTGVGVGVDPAYVVEIAAPRSGEVRTASGVRLVADVALADVAGAADTVLVPGALGARPEAGPVVVPQIVDWLREVGGRPRRIASVCAGAHMLAAAGLLDGRPATTHWFTAGRLAAEYPAVAVDPDPIFIRSGRVWTCAGVSAGMDLALAMVADDCGDDLALATARWLVMYLRRPGGQSQFSVPLAHPAPTRDDIGELHRWIADHLAADLSVAALARRVGMSERHFSRVFTAQTGVTPAAYVESVRTEAARRMLEQTGHTVEAVAQRCGFGSPETFYRVFRRDLAMTPTDYRRRFRLPADAAAGTGADADHHSPERGNRWAWPPAPVPTPR
ncbi:transcriptional regulator, AraC family with amidase-like domain [Frankia torreyi]|uniref:Transcriptional regulator, AraC family with amidase-like domain n=2 Tax=Frankia TaxID=1854 RepID=A0A0D8B8X4_9ACTN|nr:transcriptional regulator, AraC family with amidase-like domain [Frankia torreyi]KQM02120.1 transcriptional regulator, AraC family with amidase-like domain [Frankia sp. CpI1-P]